jgi:hypothetical protein
MATAPFDELAHRDKSTEELLQVYVRNRETRLRTMIIERHEALVRSSPISSRVLASPLRTWCSRRGSP